MSAAWRPKGPRVDIVLPEGQTQAVVRITDLDTYVPDYDEEGDAEYCLTELTAACEVVWRYMGQQPGFDPIAYPWFEFRRALNEFGGELA